MSYKIKNRIIELDAQFPKLIRIEEMTASIQRHSFLLVFILLSVMLAYAYDIFEFSLHIDSELDAFKKGPHLIWVGEGRWGVYFLSALLLPDPTLPVVPILIAALGYGIGLFFFIKTLSEKRGAADYFTAMIAAGCPILYFAFYWQSLAYALGIALALINIGVYCLTRWTKIGFAIATFCFCFAIATYQAVVPAIVVIYGMYLINSLLENPQASFRQYVIHSTVFGCALLLALTIYFLITPVILFIYGQGFHAEYMGSFFKIELTREYFINHLLNSLETTLKYYTGSKDYYLYHLTTLSLLFYVSLISVGCRILMNNSKAGMKIFAFTALLAVLLTPASLLMVNAGDIPIRTMFSIIFVLAGLIFIASNSASNIIKSVVCVLTIGCYFNFVVVNHRYALSSQLTWQADREFSVMLLDRMNQVYYKLPPKQKSPIDALGISTRRYPLDIIGEKDPYSESPLFIQREAIGASFYNWVQNEVRRQVSLFGVMGNFDFWPALRNERRSIIGKVLTMPSWPNAGSVDVIDGIMVIKLGDYLPTQIQSICEENDENAGCQQLLKSNTKP